MANSRSAIKQIATKKCLRDAWSKISKRNSKSRGLDNVTIRTFKNNLDCYLEQIALDLRADKYKFSYLRPHPIDKSGSTGKRLLQIPTVRDRVVMKALALAIAPTFKKLDLDCSYAYIEGRGVNFAVAKIRELVRDGYKYYFQADITNFFGSVDRELLWNKFSRRVRQKSLLPLLRQCFDLELGDLESFKTEWQDLLEGANSGIPQGGVLSPMLANFYLHEFDRGMLERNFRLIRYADDFVVMCRSIEEAQSAYAISKSELNDLGLEIHDINKAGGKSRLGSYSKDGLTFLGIRFEGADVFPGAKAVERFKHKVSEVLRPNGESLFFTLQKLRNLLTGWGRSYSSMKVNGKYLELDSFVKREVERYLAGVGVRLVSRDKRRQMKLLGIPSLVAMIDHQKRLI